MAEKVMTAEEKARKKEAEDKAEIAERELLDIEEKHPEGVKAIRDWMKEHGPDASYKRLAHILAEKKTYLTTI